MVAALTRRALLAGAGAALFALPSRAATPGRPTVTVYKSPT